MGWKASGDERAKSYQVYKDLQSAYQDLQRRFDVLEEKLRAKDETLRQLSRELYEALEAPVKALAPTVMAPAIPAAEVATPLPVQKQSAVVPKTGATMAELLGEAPKRKEG